MTDPSRTQPAPTGRHPSTVALASLITLTLLALAALGWLWLTRYAPLHLDIGLDRDPGIADARRAAFIGPLLAFGLFLIAFLWILAWIRMRWEFTLLPIAVGTAGVLALVGGFIGLSRAWSGGHEIIVMTYLCEEGAARLSADAEGLPAGCEVVPDMNGITIGTVDDPDLVRRDEASTSLSRFTDLPAGTYSATLTAQGRASTASVILAADIDDDIRALSSLDHADGQRWAGTITLHPDVDTYFLLLYPSAYPEAPQATLRFTVQQCTGTSRADFDPAACQPAAMTGEIVELLPPASRDDAGRAPVVTIENETLIFTNLEERTYVMTPDLGLTGTDVLVIPAEEVQATDSSILRQTGAPLGTFEIEVTGETRERAFIVYLIDEGVTFARVRP